MALSRALPEGQSQLFLIDGLAHVNLAPKAHDIPQLLAAMEALLVLFALERLGLERGTLVGWFMNQLKIRDLK